MRFRLLSLILLTSLSAVYVAIASGLLGLTRSSQPDIQLALFGAATGIGVVFPAIWLAVWIAKLIFKDE